MPDMPDYTYIKKQLDPEELKGIEEKARAEGRAEAEKEMNPRIAQLEAELRDLKQEQQSETGDFWFMKMVVTLREVAKTGKTKFTKKESEPFFNAIMELTAKMEPSLSKPNQIYICNESCLGHFFNNGKCWLGYSFMLLDLKEAKAKECVLSLAVLNDVVNDKIESFDKYLRFSAKDGWHYFKLDPKKFAHEERERLLANDCEEILKAVLK